MKIEAATQNKTGDVYTLSGHVVLHYRDYVVQADQVVYDRSTGEVTATGNLRLDGGPDNEHFTATHGTLNLERQTGRFFNVVGTLGVANAPHNRHVFTAPNPFAVTGREVIKLGPDRYRVLGGTMTSCRLPRPDWRLLSREIALNNGRATARNTYFTLLRVPLFYLPYVTHPVDVESRQTGFLIPLAGNDTQRGLILGEQVYWAISRNADATFGTQYYSKRGFAPMGMVRYRGLGENFFNASFRSLLDRGLQPGNINQGGVEIRADGRRVLSENTRAVADIDYLSSYIYRQAFEDIYSAAIDSEVKSQVFVAREAHGYGESVRFDRYQNYLSTSDSGQQIRLLHVPTLGADSVDRYLGTSRLMWGGRVTASGLSRSEKGFQTSRVVVRTDIYPHLSLPAHFRGWTARPEVAVRDTFYNKSQNAGPVGVLPTEHDASLNRKSIEAGFELRPPAIERDFSARWLRRLLGGDLRHALEPDVRYRNVSGISNFRSVLRFDEVDIASDTNEVYYSLTQRLFLRHLHPHPCKSDEAPGPDTTCGGGTADWLDWQVGQKYFFQPRFGGAVTEGTRNVLATTLDLTGVAFLTGPSRYSPVVSRLKLRTSTATDLEWDIDYDARLGRITTSNVFAGYRKGGYGFGIGDSRLNAPEGAATVSTTRPTGTTTNYNLLRWSATYGNANKPGLSLGGYGGYDFVLNQLQYRAFEGAYNWNCCGLSFEVRRFALGAVRNNTQYLYSFTLAGVGTAGTLRRAVRVF